MANLPEVDDFTDVYQLEPTDDVLAGLNGPTNVPLKALTNRTRFLKNLIDKFRTVGEIQMLVPAVYDAASYDADGLGLAGTEAHGWQLCNGVNNSLDTLGKVLLGGTPLQGQVYEYGQTGGAETHVLTVSELANHGHTVALPYGQSNSGSGQPVRTDGRNDGTKQYSTDTVGGNQPHNNMQPWLSVIVRQWVGK